MSTRQIQNVVKDATSSAASISVRDLLNSGYLSATASTDHRNETRGKVPKPDSARYAYSEPVDQNPVAYDTLDAGLEPANELEGMRRTSLLHHESLAKLTPIPW